MIRKTFAALTLSALALGASLSNTAHAAARNLEPSSRAAGAGAWATGTYRNLFAEAGHSEKEIRRKIDSAFEQLFHGNPETQTVYYAAGSNSNGPLAYITDIK